MTERDRPDPGPADTPRTLEAVIASLRRLAVAALDAGEPMAAARIATTADRLEVEAWPSRPRRPGYGRPKADLTPRSPA